ncbi:MAG: cation:dicarboxylate symporter family transporter [Verrucomicrobiales bacterium]
MSQAPSTSPADPPPSPSKRRMGLAPKVLIGMVLGILCGVVFGEWMASLKIIGDLFIGLLQMTVLPYIVVSLVLALGSLSYENVKTLARAGGVWILILWGIGLGVIPLMALSYPDWPSASFFSTSLIESPSSFDPVKTYVPSNPFFSLANGVVPAIVLFSLALGLALIGVPRKQGLLDNLQIASDAIMRIAQFVVSLAPYGVFALVAATAGTISLDDLGRLEVYLFSYIAVALLLGLLILPGLVSVLTPISYRQFLSKLQGPLLTAFATYNLLIVLPLLTEKIKELLKEAKMDGAETESAADLIVPINFNLPNLGKLLGLSFIPFAGWFAGAPIAAEAYPQLLISGLLTFFGEVVVALPFLLDTMGIPADTFDVFLSMDQFSGRFGTMLAGVHTATLGILMAAVLSRKLRVRWGALIRFILISLVATIGVLGGLRFFFERVTPQTYDKYEALYDLDMVSDRPEVRIVALEELAADSGKRRGDRESRIQERGEIRVGYIAATLPFVYERNSGELSGLEVDMVQLMANQQEVSVAFVPVQKAEIAALLENGTIDIAIGGLFATPDLAANFRLSVPYMTASLGVIVKDRLRSNFSTWEKIRKIPGLHLAVVNLPFLENQVRRKFPSLEITSLSSPSEFFEAEPGVYDALIYSAEAGSAWTLLYPDYSVVVPGPNLVSAPISMGLPSDDGPFTRYVNAWLELSTVSGTGSRLYQHWILGEGSKSSEKRWSVIHNLFQWD